MFVKDAIRALDRENEDILSILNRIINFVTHISGDLIRDGKRITALEKEMKSIKQQINELNNGKN